MMWISFAWTTRPLLMGLKTETRRFWSDVHVARIWGSALQNNMQVGACDKDFRYKGKRIGIIRLKMKPYKQKLALVTDADEKAEGGLWGSAQAFIDAMGGPDKEPWVVKFDFIPDKEYDPSQLFRK